MEAFRLLHCFKPLWWIFKFEHEFRVWHPRYHDYAFVAYPRLSQYHSYGTSSPHVTLQRTIDLKKEKYLVANTKIGMFCTNLNLYTWIFAFCAMPFKDRNLGWQYQRWTWKCEDDFCQALTTRHIIVFFQTLPRKPKNFKNLVN